MRDDGFLVEVVNGVPVVAAPGEIDITNSSELQAALLAAAARGHGTLVADLAATHFCDSSGLRALVVAHEKATDEGGGLLLVIRSTAVARLLTITSVDLLIPHFKTVEEALAQASAGPLTSSCGPA